MTFPSMGSIPGQQAKVEDYQTILEWGGAKAQRVCAPVGYIHSASVDAGSSPTTKLRAGLLMGLASSGTYSGFYKQWDPAATDGSQDLVGFLSESINMVGLSGSVEHKQAPDIICAGTVKAANLTILGTALTSSTYERFARQLMSRRFIFDDEVPAKLAMPGFFPRQIAKTANYTIVAGDNGTRFTNLGASGTVIFTLPAIKPGMVFEFFVIADQTVSVTKADGTLVTDNSTAGTTLSFSTASHKIGGHLMVESDPTGTYWIPTVKSASTNTLTVS